jgi:hypothetical protein
LGLEVSSDLSTSLSIEVDDAQKEGKGVDESVQRRVISVVQMIVLKLRS